jgi:tRNA-dihydrouridine synthase A
MVTTGAVLHGKRESLLGFDPLEQPVALQLGGSDPAELARCAVIAQQWGYDEVNLNVGCPSDRVQKGRFGACLMLEPELVRDCISAMREAVDIPVTVKNRLGVDDHYSYQHFHDFVETVAESGCSVFIAHARILSGLSPKQNRDVPPLHHDWVYRLKQERPDLTIVINGGVDSLVTAVEHLQHVDGVMIGRAAYHNPWLLAVCQGEIFGAGQPRQRQDVVAAMNRYIAEQISQGVAVKHISRHVLGLFSGQPGARIWRRYISENAHRDDQNTHLLEDAMARVSELMPSA